MEGFIVDLPMEAVLAAASKQVHADGTAVTAENARKAVLEGDNCAVEHRIGALIAVTVDNGVAGEAPHGHDLSRRLVLPRDVRQRLANDFGH